MSDISMADIEIRIRERAHRIWEEEGRPEGRDQAHWELAKFAIAQEDGLATALIPAAAAEPEPLDAVINQEEFPTLVDQGEGFPPTRVEA